VYVRSGKQKLAALSFTESELLALTYGAQENIYLRDLLGEMGWPQRAATPIHQDNKSAITVATKGDLGTKRTKHFTVRHYFFTEQIQRGTARLAYLPGKIIPEDGLTKPLTGPAGRAWAFRLLGHRDPNLAQVRGGVLDRVPERAAGTQQRPQESRSDDSARHKETTYLSAHRGTEIGLKVGMRATQGRTEATPVSKATHTSSCST